MSSFDFSKNKFIGVLTLNSIFSPAARAWLLAVCGTGAFTPLILAAIREIIAYTLKNIPDAISASIPAIPFVPYNTFFLGLSMIFSAPWLAIIVLEGFANSKSDKKTVTGDDPNIGAQFNYLASSVWFAGPKFSRNTNTRILFEALESHEIGVSFLSRLGVGRETYQEFLRVIETGSGYEPLENLIAVLGRRGSTPVTGVEPLHTREITFTDLVTALFGQTATKEFFDSKDIPAQTIRRCAEWVENAYYQADRKRRWWLRENLARLPGIGKDWAYGSTPLLQKFAYDIQDEALRLEGAELIGREREIELMESALLKQSGANIIIVGEPGAGKYTTLLGLVRLIAWGQIFPQLEHKRVFKLQGSALIASGKTKGGVEELFIRLMNEAVGAGNIILTIDEFPEFVDSLSQTGVNAMEMLSPYLSSSGVHILALAEVTSFRRSLENNTGLMKYFSRIDITEPETERLLEILEKHAPSMERVYGGQAIFTYPSVEKAAQGATEHLVSGALPKRAIDLMEEVMKETISRGLAYVTPEIVMEVIAQKTKIPLGEIGPEEQEKLIKLEEFLAKRVIGQTEAVRAVADAIRRARSGIKNPKRPIGTFLFLGPTGVGKTETAKALAEAYFGNEETMARFDMTEYQTEEGFEKLVGSFEKNEPGLLTSRMHSSPYVLVLLDEFEKSNPKAKNLFLQVLDEGFFTDHLGRRVNMRNTIIIATSNAGAKLIWELVKRGADPATMRHELFSYIQNEGIYSPELLNRFDAVVVFHPLQPEILAHIARLGLEKLATRLEKSKNIKLRITEPLVEAVGRGGYDPVFGARPMQRFIQDKVEKLIADKIIRKEIPSGGEFSFSPEELAALVS